MSRNFRWFQRDFDPLSRTWELDTVLDLRPGPVGVGRSLVSIKGEQEPKWVLTTWLTDDEISAYHVRRRSQSTPPPPTIFIKTLLQPQSLRTPSQPLLTSVDDISLSCDQLGNIYFKPTEVDSQEIQKNPAVILNDTHQQSLPSTLTYSQNYSTEFPKLEQPGTYLKTKPALSPTNGVSIDRYPQLPPQQRSQLHPQLQPTPHGPETVNSSKFLNPTQNSTFQRPPPLQIPSTPKLHIPLLSPRAQPPPLPVSVILFILLHLLTQVSQTSFPPPTPPPTSPHFLQRRVVCA